LTSPKQTFLLEVSTKVLLNGVVGGHVTNRRGLRQENSISNFLSMKVLVVLNRMLEIAGQVGIHHHTSIFADEVVTFLRSTPLELVSYAALADDFGEASPDYAPTSVSA
jgi:hypothetical protein